MPVDIVYINDKEHFFIPCSNSLKNTLKQFKGYYDAKLINNQKKHGNTKGDMPTNQ